VRVPGPQAVPLAGSKATGSTKKHRTRQVAVRSLKTPQEVAVLRSIHGQRCVVIGVSASERTSGRAKLVRQLKHAGMSTVEAASEASYLLQRDERDDAELRTRRRGTGAPWRVVPLAASEQQPDAPRLIRCGKH
jgi:hypothetical protein